MNCGRTVEEEKHSRWGELSEYHLLTNSVDSGIATMSSSIPSRSSTLRRLHHPLVSSSTSSSISAINVIVVVLVIVNMFHHHDPDTEPQSQYHYHHQQHFQHYYDPRFHYQTYQPRCNPLWLTGLKTPTN